MFQALYDPKEAGTWTIDVKVDAEACANLLDPTFSTLNSSQLTISDILLPSMDKHGPPWASEVQVAVATVALDADGHELQDTFYPYYGSTTRKIVVPTAPHTFQSEYRPYAIMSLSAEQGVGNTAEQSPVGTGQSTVLNAQRSIRATAEQVQEESFVLEVRLSSHATAPIHFVVVESDEAAEVLDAAEDPRSAILCALGICLDSSQQDVWSEGSIVVSGSLAQQLSAGERSH